MELASIERLRSLRVKPERDLTLTRAFLGEQVVLRRLRRSNAGLAEAWTSVAPDGLRERAMLRGVSAGVATIAVTDAAARYQVDRWLRSGGEKALLRACPAPVRKVKVVVESAEPPKSPSS